MTGYFLILALLLGLAPAIIAHGKGRNFLVWWAYGAVLGPVALLHSIMLRGGRRPALEAAPESHQTPWHSPWPLLLRVAASFAIAIVAVAAYRFFVPPDSGPPTGRQEVAVSTDRTPPERSRGLEEKADETAAAEKQPAIAPPPRPSPTVNVTVRENADPGKDVAVDDGAVKDGPTGKDETPTPAASEIPAIPSIPVEPAARTGQTATAETEKSAEPSAPEQVAAPEPPPPAPPPPSKRQLERTVPQERTVAEKPASAREAEEPPVKDIETLAARTAPTEPSETDAAERERGEARKQSLRRDTPEEPARRKPPARKASAPKAAPSPPPSPPPSDVTAVGETVRVVQQALAARGYDPGPANGRAGRQTEEAIRKFQEDRGLKPTGSIDYAVLETLNIVGPRVHAFQPPPGATIGR